jgi:hypothetical protein
LHISADWRALVLRDGAAFVATRPDGGADDPFFGFAELYVRTIYLDALLLGLLQDRVITNLEDEIGTALDAPHPRTPMTALEEQVTHFRQILWWRHVTRHGIANDLLAAYQRQHRLQERFDQVRADIADFTSTDRQDTGQRIQAIVALITLAAVPATISFTAIQVVGVKGGTQLLAFLSAVVVSTTVLMLTRPARTMLGLTRQRLYRRENKRS